MSELERRSLICAAFLAPFTLLAEVLASAPQVPRLRVPRGEDREQKKRWVGSGPTAFKVLTAETKGGLFVMENSHSTKGGPPRHIHHGEDELFYSLEGDFIVEVGSDRVRLQTGDCVLGPRGIPHTFAFVGDTPGRLLLAFAPAGKMEAFFNSREGRGMKPGVYGTSADAAVYREFGMEYVGPPLKIA